MVAERNERGNGPVHETPSENPVQLRRPLRQSLQEVSSTEPQDSAARKMANNQILFCTRLDVMDADLVNLGRDMIIGFAALAEKIDYRMEALAGVAPAVLPSMRRREDSEHMIDQTAESVGQKGRDKAQQIVETPNIDLTPDVVGQLIKSEVKEALIAQREDDKRKKLEADAAAAEAKRVADAAEVERQRLIGEQDDRDRARDKRNAKYLTWSGIIVGIVVLVATTAVSFMQGRHTGHDEGFAERAVVPSSVVIVPPAAIVPAASSVPPTATGAVAPRGH